MPTAAAPTQPPRERILQAAADLFYAHGVRGVGVDRVVAASGVAKATLYAHFPSKDDLVVEYLRRADLAWRDKLRAAATTGGPDPRDQLVALFTAVSTACSRAGFRGCAFLNTAAESEPGTPVHAETVAHKAAVRAWIRTLADAAGAPEPDALAVQLTVLLDGALAAAALEPTAKVTDAATSAAAILVRSACPGAARTALTRRPRPGAD